MKDCLYLHIFFIYWKHVLCFIPIFKKKMKKFWTLIWLFSLTLKLASPHNKHLTEKLQI